MQPDRWSNDSPCEGWCAREVLAHQASALTAVTRIAESGEMVGPADFDIGDDPVTTWNAVLATLDQPGVLQQEDQFFFGEPTVDDLVGFVDPLGHSWDLAQAEHADPGVAQHAVDTITPMADMLRK